MSGSLTTVAPALGDGPTSGSPRVLVAGIGNIFFGDDAFGVVVVDQVLRRPVPAGVTVADFGIRGLHLAYELLDGYDALVLVDAMPLDDEPGTVALVEIEMPTPPGTDADSTAEGAQQAPDPGGAGQPGAALDAHSMSPHVVLASLVNLGGSVDRVLVVGCQPSALSPGMGLSPVVAAAVDGAVQMIDRVLIDLLSPTERSENET